MSLFKKPSTKKTGLKVLCYGASGVGKTVFSLSFNKIYVIDAETGTTFYQSHPTFGKNLLGVANTQSFNDLEEAMDEMRDMGSDEVGTLVIDSESKIYQNLQDTVLQLEEKKARRAGRDVMDSAVSMRGWGRIKSIAQRLQNLKIDLSATGINVVSIAQEEDVKQKMGDNFVKVGEKPVMQKNSEFDYDIVLRIFTEKDENGNIVRKAEIKKDRTGVTKEGQIVENPSYGIWEAHCEGRKDAELVQSNLAGDMEKATSALEKQIEAEEKELGDRLKELIAQSAEHKAKAQELLKKYKITSLSPSTPTEKKNFEAVIKVLEAM